MAAHDPAGRLLDEPLGDGSERSEARHVRWSLTIAIEHLDGAHHHAVCLLEAGGMMQRSSRRHLGDHLLFDDALTADLFEKSTFLLVAVGSKDAQRVDLVEKQLGHL